MNREDFPMTKENLIYFDNAATTLKPKIMLDYLKSYYYEYCSNAHRGDYDISLKTDEMYEKADLHEEQGDWQMIFGVNTIPAYRRCGLAEQLLKRAIADAKTQGRKGLVLTCKDKLIHYYAKFGFENEGVSESTHGNVVWNQMRLTF